MGSRPSGLGEQRQGEGESCHSAFPASFTPIWTDFLPFLVPSVWSAQPLPAEGQSYQGLCIHLQLGTTVGAGSFSFGPL